MQKKENGGLGACGVPRSVFSYCGQRLPVVAVVVTPITTLVPAAHHLPATLVPAAQHLAVEAVLSIQDVIELGGRDDAEELVVVGLLDALELKVVLVALADVLLAAFLVGGLAEAQLALALVDSALLGLHLLVVGEELSCLLRCEAGFLGDELLEVGLELLRREFLRLLAEPLRALTKALRALTKPLRHCGGDYQECEQDSS